jgi:hypothetical protein
VRWQTLVNDGGIVANLRRRPWQWLLVPGFLLASCWAARRELRSLRPGVVHAHWLIPQGLIAAALCRGKRAPGLLVTSHGADLYALRSWPLPALKRWVARRASALTVVSAAMVDALSRSAPIGPGSRCVRWASTCMDDSPPTRRSRARRKNCCSWVGWWRRRDFAICSTRCHWCARNGLAAA